MKKTMLMLILGLLISGLTENLLAQVENEEVRLKLKVMDSGSGEFILLDTSFVGDEQKTRIHTLRDIRVEKGDGEMRFAIEALVDSVLETLEWNEFPDDGSEKRGEIIARKSSEGDHSFIFIKMHKASLMKMDLDDLKTFAPLLKEAGVSAGKEAEGIEINLYPNPSDGLFTLELQSFNPEPIRTEVYNLEGRKISSEEIQPVEGKLRTQLDLREHSAGTYLLVIRQGKESLSRKIVLKE